MTNLPYTQNKQTKNYIAGHGMCDPGKFLHLYGPIISFYVKWEY